MLEDRKLTDHFTLFDLTKTSGLQFQEKNRELTEEQIMKLTDVARLLEHVMYVLGTGIMVTSGYRCLDLNRDIGSTDLSQHVHCEAADFIPNQQELGFAFRALWRDVKDNKTNVGQLIHETAARPGGFTSWIHISLGRPYRREEMCGEILRMENGQFTRLA